MSSYRVMVITDNGTKIVRVFEQFGLLLQWLQAGLVGFSKIEITKFGR